VANAGSIARARAGVRTEYGGIDRSAACMHAAVDTENIVHTDRPRSQQPRACDRSIDPLCSIMKKKRASDHQLPVPCLAERLVASYRTHVIVEWSG
jgi:hypothetical protein